MENPERAHGRKKAFALPSEVQISRRHTSSIIGGNPLSSEAVHRIFQQVSWLTDRRAGRPFSCDNAQWMLAAALPAHSDRIAQDLHLIPFYPRARARGTENPTIQLYAFIITASCGKVNPLPAQSMQKTCASLGCAPVRGSISSSSTSRIYAFHRSTTGLSACTRSANAAPCSHS